MRLEGRKALVTGGASGIGAAIAGALADNPGYQALAQCSHAHGPVLGSTTPAQPAQPVARSEPALKEG
jgi:NAD(P)-dependent dehydrogenase (short-subunit alcohol dehydrogenase family)